MKEIGDKNAERADLFCTMGDCEFNDVDYGHGPRPVEQVIANAKKHDLLEGHEAIVVRYDDEHPLSKEDEAELMVLTGVVSD